MTLLARGLLCGLGVAGVFATVWFANSLFESKPSINGYLVEEEKYPAIYGDEDTVIGKKYGSYLVGTYGKDGIGNRSWWKDSYRRYQESLGKNKVLSEQFGKDKVKYPFANKDVEDDNSKVSLNKVCEVIYKDKVEDLNKEDNKLSKDFWSFCSPLGKPPLTIEEAKEKDKYTEEKSAGKTKAKELLSTLSEDNKNLWEIKNTNFHKLEPEDTYFKQAFKDKKNIKDTCEEAYKVGLDESKAELPKEENIVKYCSI